jgi:hypothetical protein
MQNLDSIYHSLYPENFSFKLESLAIAKLVHDYRYFWKPEKIKTLLLAESHVFTPDDDTTIPFSNAFHNFSGLVDYPNQFANFIYCLGYGEKQILTTETQSKNAGTWQFWQLFNSTCDNKFKVLKKIEPDFQKRIREKIALLTEMKMDGIWLLDCSFLAIYNDSVKPHKKEMDAILSHSFRNYCLPIINQENPEKVIVIGKTVFDIIQNSHPNIMTSHWDWIHQPNARVKKENRRSL